MTLYVSICCPLFTLGLTVQVLGGDDDLKVLEGPLYMSACIRLSVNHGELSGEH